MPVALASPTPHPHNGPGVQTAVSRVFYDDGGITPDIEVKEPASTPVRARIAEAAFHFTRQLAAGVLPGLDSSTKSKRCSTAKDTETRRLSDHGPRGRSVSQLHVTREDWPPRSASRRSTKNKSSLNCVCARRSSLPHSPTTPARAVTARQRRPGLRALEAPSRCQTPRRRSA